MTLVNQVHVDHSSSSTPMCWVEGDEPPVCTDDLKSILVNTVINLVAGSIASSGSNTDLSLHNLEQLVYKVENQQGLWDISTCTNSNMGGLYYDSKLSKSIVSSARNLNFLFDSSSRLESTISSQSFVSVDLSMDVSNSTQDFTTLYSIHMLKQNILQSCCDSISYGSNLSGNYDYGSLSTVNNALCCTDNSFNQETLSNISLVGYYGDITLKYNKSPEQSGRILEGFSFSQATRQLSTGTKYIRTFGFLPLNNYQFDTKVVVRRSILQIWLNTLSNQMKWFVKPNVLIINRQGSKFLLV